MNTGISKFITLILISLFTIGIRSSEVKFQRQSPIGGFSYDGVKDIVQDKDGFMWFILNNEIIRYDGYTYKYYFNEITQKNTSSLLQLNQLQLNKEKEVFVSSNQGIFKYNIQTDGFEMVNNRPTSNFYIDSLNYFWLNIKDELHIINTSNQQSLTPRYQGKLMKYMTLFQEYNNSMYMSSYFNKIYACDLQNENREIQLVYAFNQKTKIIDFHIREHNLWVLTDDNYIHQINLDSTRITSSSFIHSQSINKNLHIDKENNIWIGSQNGLIFIDHNTKKQTIFNHEPNKDSSLPNNSIWCIKEDNRENIWIGTFSGGVCNLSFEELFTSFNDKEGYTPHITSCFSENASFIWIGTEGDGILSLDRNSSKLLNTNVTSKNIKSLAIDNLENLWAGTFREGIFKYSIKEDKLHNEKQLTKKDGLLSNDIRKLEVGGDNLWISYQLNKAVISRFDINSNIIEHINLDGSGKSSYIFDILKKDNTLWAVSRNTLYELDTSTKEVKEILSEKNIAFNAQCLALDSSYLWIGTIGNGIIRYNIKDKTISEFSSIFTNRITSVYAIQPDKDDLWISTDNGILQFNKKNHSILAYSTDDGLQGQAFYPLSSLKTRNQEIYFGGTNGFNKVNPKKLQHFSDTLTSIITEFYVNQTLHKSLNYKYEKNSINNNTIILEPNQNNIGFTLSSDNFLNPLNTIFYYRLIGYHDKWIEVGFKDRNISFSQLSPKKYTLEIYATRNNDTPIGDVYTVDIIIEPYWWQTWWAICIYIFAFAIIVYFIIHHYSERRKLKINLLLQEFEQEKQKEINKAQNNFFTHVSHDLRTPLSLILATIDHLKENGIEQKSYTILKNNSSRLLNLVNELLDSKNITSNKIQNTEVKVDINELIDNICADFEKYTQDNNIDLKIFLDEDLPNPVTIDKNHIEKILINIIDNSIKNVKDNPIIEIKTFKDRNEYTPVYKNSHKIISEKSKNHFSILIRDNGIGIPKDILSKIFTQYYRNKKFNKTGNGIGLAIVKELVLANNGNIEIFSEENKGTDFLLSFPLKTNDHEDKNIKIQKTNKPITKEIYSRNKEQILIVEDNDDLRMLIADFLRSKYNVLEAQNGKIALDILMKEEIDLIISDIMMPEMDGISLLQAVKSNIEYSHIPFILLTAKTETDSKIEAISAGADIYFEKPIDLYLLLISVDNLFLQREKIKQHFAKNFFANTSELSKNEKDNKFLKDLITIIDDNINSPTVDVTFIASQLGMSRTKLYSKIKMITGKTIVEFILHYKLKMAANLMIETEEPIFQIINKVGIKSQSYFTSVFKKEFGDTPTNFILKHKNKKHQ